MMGLLIENALILDKSIPFNSIPTEFDPRGFSELYGDPDKTYSTLGPNSFKFKNFSIFWDSITFEVPGSFKVTIENNEDHLVANIISIEDDRLLSSENISSYENIEDYINKKILIEKEKEEVV
ncbi:MAG: hypothetical protein MSS69_02410 [Spirochaetales bacterium]|nr:hypothetical protein [Spirochaetales bacterium]